MAQDSKFDWEEFDGQRLAAAVEELRESANLRFLFRTLMRDMGVGQDIPSGNALQTASHVGQYQSGMMLVNMMLTYDPHLYPALIEDDIKEQQLRSNNEGMYDAD